MRTKATNKIFIGLVVVVLAVAAIWAIGSGQFSIGNKLGTQNPSGNPNPNPNSPPAGNTYNFQGICDTNTQKSVKFSLSNSLNTTGTTEWIGATAQIYTVDANGNEAWKTSATTSSPTTATAVSLDCGQKYAYYVTSNGTYNSYRGTYDLSTPSAAQASKPVITGYPADWQGLFFRAYDNTQGAYIYSTGANNGTAYLPTGTVFYQSSTNASGNPIGTSGSIDYRVDFETNNVVSSTSQFTDQNFWVSAKMTTSDYNPDSAMLSATAMSGQPATVTKQPCPVKLARDLYNVCWQVTQGSSPLLVNIGNTPASVRFTISALQGVNPATNITLAFNTGGYVLSQQTASTYNIYNKLGTDVADDQGSPAYIHTQQTVVFALA